MEVSLEVTRTRGLWRSAEDLGSTYSSHSSADNVRPLVSPVTHSAPSSSFALEMAGVRTKPKGAVKPLFQNPPPNIFLTTSTFVRITQALINIAHVQYYFSSQKNAVHVGTELTFPRLVPIPIIVSLWIDCFRKLRQQGCNIFASTSPNLTCWPSHGSLRAGKETSKKWYHLKFSILETFTVSSSVQCT